MDAAELLPREESLRDLALFDRSGDCALNAASPGRAYQREENGLADYDLISGLEVDRALRRFVEEEALPGTGIGAGAFWFGFSALLRDLTPENKRLLRVRDDLQARIDARNASLGGRAPSPAEDGAFLREISYLLDPPPPFMIGTEGVDPEI